jgi:hypothetical protein
MWGGSRESSNPVFAARLVRHPGSSGLFIFNTLVRDEIVENRHELTGP